MKKFLKIVVFLSLAFSCQPVAEPKFTESQFSEIGASHNKALDFVLASLSEERKKIAAGQSGKFTTSQLLQFSQDAATRYIVQEGADLSREEMKLAIEKSNAITERYSQIP